MYLPQPKDIEDWNLPASPVQSPSDHDSDSKTQESAQDEGSPAAHSSDDNTSDDREAKTPDAVEATDEDTPVANLAHDLDVERQDVMEFAYRHAFTPALNASNLTEDLLQDCLSIIQIGFNAIHTQRHHKDKYRKALRKYKTLAANKFQQANQAEQAHLVEELKHISAYKVPDPKSYSEAINDPNFQHYWNEAIIQEIANLKEYGVYKYEPIQPGCRPINSHFVFKVKSNSAGLVDRFKARLVAQGYRQRFGIDYLKTHASVCKLQTFRAQMAHCITHDLQHEIGDVKSAYLESDMDPDMPVYINIPGDNPAPGTAARLIKSLYGLKQAGHNWYETIIPLLKQWGFQQSEADPCFLTHVTAPLDYCTLCLFVDDFSLCSTKKKQSSRNLFWTKLNELYKTSLADDKNVYLNIRCTRVTDTLLFVDQEPYVNKFLAAYNFQNLKPVATPTSSIPLSIQQQPIEAAERKAMDKFPFRQIVGSLRYLEQCTRPDISFALNRLARYQSNPGLPHWNALKHLVRYVSATKNYGLIYGLNGYPTHAKLRHDLHGPLECFVDSDHASDKDTRRSCTGYVFYSRGGPISWRSRLQKTTALSTTEAEFMAASEAACENIWLRHLFESLTPTSTTRIHGMLCPKDISATKISQYFYSSEVPTKFNEDNIGCIRCSENPVLHGRMKHIDIRYHRLKEFVKNGSCKLIYVPTDRQIADVFTKPLNKTLLKLFRDCLVLPPPTPLTDDS